MKTLLRRLAAAIRKSYYKRIITTLIAAIVAVGAMAQEMTMYVIPPKRPMRWNSPQLLMISYARSLMAPEQYEHSHAMGHLIVELKDSSRYAIAGMTARRRYELSRRVCLDGYGLGILYTAVEGRLVEGQDNTEDIAARCPAGDVAFITFKLSSAAFDRLWTYLQEYKQNGYDKIYNGSNRPREGTGAGCSAFAMSFVELAGLLPGEVLKKWQKTIHVPTNLAGGPGDRVGIKNILLRTSWADTLREPYKTITYYEPAAIFDWIRSYDGQPQPYTIAQKRGNAAGIREDCRKCIVPDSPIWITTQRNTQGLATR